MGRLRIWNSTFGLVLGVGVRGREARAGVASKVSGYGFGGQGQGLGFMVSGSWKVRAFPKLVQRDCSDLGVQCCCFKSK